MIGIYKITNQINNKIYIGQSINIESRWQKHKYRYNNQNYTGYDYYIYRAMRKYGIDNFNFEVIEECKISELDERERFWIKHYDSYKNGYNETEGGNNARHPIKISPQMLVEIDSLLQESILSIGEIADKFHVSYEMIQGINTGRHWYRENIQYPIGQYKIGVKKNNTDQLHKAYCCDCGKEISQNALRCWDCYVESCSQYRPTQNELLQLLSENSMEAVGRIFKVSGKAIRKWCDQYGIPHLKKDVKKYIIENNIKFY